jgi:hypothetical protein
MGWRINRQLGYGWTNYANRTTASKKANAAAYANSYSHLIALLI